MATTGADNPVAEFPIYIENALCTREYSHRALAADGLHRIPVDPYEEFWNQLAEIPRDPPSLVVNAGPGAGVVELVAMVLQPAIGSKLKWEFADWVGSNGPPATPNVSTPLSRVIPATFGLGAYQPTLTGAPAHDGHSWVVDGLNHFVEFPYGPPAGLPDAPVLTFYRYTGATGGGGGTTSGTGPLVLNKSIYPGNYLSFSSRVWPSIRSVGDVWEYFPQDKLIPKDLLFGTNNSFSFEASGMLKVRIQDQNLKSSIFIGIMMGDPATFNGSSPNPSVASAYPIGDVIELDASFYDVLAVWSFKLTLNRIPPASFLPATGINSVYSIETSIIQKDGMLKTPVYKIQGGSAIQRPQEVDGKIQFSIYMGCPDLPSVYDPTDPNRFIEVYKLNHVFRQIA
jgi:hypothetical protein